MKTTDCPAYDEIILDTWFPYEEGSTYYFSDTLGSIDTMVISNVEKTAAHSVTWRNAPFNGKKLYCETYGKINSRTSKEHPGWLNASIVHNVSDKQAGDMVSFQLNFQNLEVNLQPDIQLDSVSNLDKYRLTALENITLNGTTYNEVRQIETVKPVSGIDRLYIAKGRGIIGYRTFPAKVEYWIR